jgi:spherulation-specific family 4 protein
LVSLLQTSVGILAQTYYPVTSTAWDTIISAKNANPSCPIAVVVNVAGDGAGTSTNTSWNSLINRLRTAGIIVLGWVDTNFATIAEATVQGAINQWSSWYPQIDGIFFQSMSNQTTNQTYYDNLHNYARTTAGFSTTCGNAKTTVPTGFLNGGTTDVVIVWDNSGLDPVDSTYSQYNTMENNTLGVSAFAVPTLNTAWISQMSQYVGWIYVTSDSGAAPYDTIPGYFTQLVEYVDSLSGGGSGEIVNDKFGIRKIYHTKLGGEEFFTNQTDLMADAVAFGRIQNFEGENLTKLSDGSYQSDGGSEGDLRLEIWSPAYSNTQQRLDARWLNAEVTVYQRTTDIDTSRDPPYAFQLYAKGGHHTSARPCEGCAYKCRWWNSDGAVSFDKEVCHSSYAGNFNKVLNQVTEHFGNNKWHGGKFCQYNIVESGNTYVKIENYVDPDCSDSNNNLIVANNWKLATSRVDRGGIAADSAPGDCSGCGRPLDEILINPYSVTNSGSGNFNRNLCAYRTDGVTTRFKYFSAREIDPTKPVGSGDPDDGGGGGGGTTLDQFGVKKIYPTATNGYEFYMPATPGTDTTNWDAVPSASITTNADGSFKMTTAASTPVILYAFQRNGYNGTVSQTNAQNHAQLASQGWMQDSSDFRNIEMTAYYKLNTTPATSNFEFTARGGKHLEPQPNAEGTALRAHLSSTGNLQFLKEQWHASQVSESAVNVTTSIIGRWIGVKYVVVNKTINNTLVTKQEFWIDNLADNTWTKVGEKVDAGGWGTQGGQFGGAPDQLISWGGPACIFMWSDFTNVDFKWLSVRELDPAGIPIDTPPDEPPSHCGTGV